MNNECGHWLNCARHTRSPNERTMGMASGAMLWHIPRVQISQQWLWPLRRSSGTAQKDNNKFGLDDFCSLLPNPEHIPCPSLTTSDANTLPPSSQNSLDKFGMDNLHSPSPDPRCASYHLFTTSSTDTCLSSLQDGLDKFNLDNSYSPLLESSHGPLHILELTATSDEAIEAEAKVTLTNACSESYLPAIKFFTSYSRYIEWNWGM